VDSLVNVLETEKLTPDEQLLIYQKLCTFYENNGDEKKMFYAEKGLNLAKKENNKFRMAEFNNIYGRYYFDKGDHELALESFNTAIALAIEIKDKELEGQTYGNFAVFYSNKGDYKTGIEYYQKSISCFESIGKEDGTAMWLANIGGMYRLLGEPDLAARYLKKAEKIAEKINDKRALSKVYSSLGNLHWELKELDKAMEYGQKSLKVSQEMHYKLGEANTYQTLAAISIEKKQYNEAENFASECLRLAKELNNKRLISVAWNALSNVYLNQDRYKEAETASYTAWEIDSTNLLVGDNSLGNIIHANISMGNKEKAKEYFDKYVDYKTEINNKNVRENLMEMEVKYETEKKELRIATLEKERQLYIWLGMAGVLLVISLGIALWQTIKGAKREKQLIASRSIQDGEMGERTRLAHDLHDRLGGILTSVRFELKNSKESTQSVYDKLDSCIEEIRRVAHNLMPLSLQHGMKVALEDYAALFPNVYFHFFGEEKRIEKRKEFVIYCCASELVNNSLRHSGATIIVLQLVQDEKHVSLTVQDDGCGFNEKTTTKGLGLKSIRDRISSCDGKMDIVTSPGKGTEITIELKTGN
jgi:signal transduction histidine kinase